MNDVTIYHNPACGTSRNTLALIRNAGIEPAIVLYLQATPDKETLIKVISNSGLSVREAFRRKDTPYDELQLDDPNWTDDQLIAFALAHPILINRPFVVTPTGTRLCRPSEVVLDILHKPQLGAFTKEDGERVIDAEGQRAQPRA